MECFFCECKISDDTGFNVCKECLKDSAEIKSSLKKLKDSLEDNMDLSNIKPGDKENGDVNSGYKKG